MWYLWVLVLLGRWGVLPCPDFITARLHLVHDVVNLSLDLKESLYGYQEIFDQKIYNFPKKNYTPQGTFQSRL